MPLRSPSSERHPAWWARSWAGLAALSAIFLAANLQLLTGSATEHWDGEQFFAPFFAYLANTVRSGHWLLWNPFGNAGSPDFAEPQVGAFSPITLAFAALGGPGALAFRTYWLCVWLLGGFGMFAYARSLGAPAWGRLLAGAAWVFSGFYLGHAQHTSVVYSISFLPWIVWRLDRALLTGRRWPAVEAGALWGLSALAGNPAITISTGLFVGAFALVRLWGEKARVRSGLIALSLFAALGAVVLAPAFFSFKYESLGYSDRSGPLSRECAVESNPVLPEGLTATLQPYLPSQRRANKPPDSTAVLMSPMYFGAAPLALALLAVALPGGRRWKWGLGAVALLFLGFTLGTTLPLRGWLYDLVPPTRYFRHPNMFRAYFIFAVLVLAVLATAHLERWRARGAAPAGAARRFALLAAILGAVGVGAMVCTAVRMEKLGPSWPTALAHAGLVWLGLPLLTALAAARPAWLARLPTALVVLTIGDLLCAHYLSADEAFAVGYGEQPRPAARRSPVELGAENFARGAIASSNQHLYFHKPVYCSYAALLNTLHMDSAESPALMQYATGRERVWFSPEVVEAPASGEAFEHFARELAERGAPVLLWHPRATPLGEASAPPLEPAALRRAPTATQVPFAVETYRANELTLRISAPQDGWLLVTDRWSRSWRATVNGVATPIDGGNFFFRLLPVRAGENLVAMHFEPFLLWPLLVASWGTLLVVAAVAATRRIPRRTLPEPAMPPLPEPCGASS